MVIVGWWLMVGGHWLTPCKIHHEINCHGGRAWFTCFCNVLFLFSKHQCLAIKHLHSYSTREKVMRNVIEGEI